MSKRERMVMIVAMSAAGLYLLDLIFVGPFFAEWNDVSQGIEKKSKELDGVRILLKHEMRSQGEWKKLRKRLDSEKRAATTEELLVHIDEIGRKAGVSRDIMNIKPSRDKQTGDFREVSLEASLETSITGMKDLLVELYNSSEFLKISRLTVTSRLGDRKRKDRLDVDIKISTIQYAPIIRKRNGRNGRGSK